MSINMHSSDLESIWKHRQGTFLFTPTHHYIWQIIMRNEIFENVSTSIIVDQCIFDCQIVVKLDNLLRAIRSTPQYKAYSERMHSNLPP